MHPNLNSHVYYLLIIVNISRRSTTSKHRPFVGTFIYTVQRAGARPILRGLNSRFLPISLQFFGRCDQLICLFCLIMSSATSNILYVVVMAGNNLGVYAVFLRLQRMCAMKDISNNKFVVPMLYRYRLPQLSLSVVSVNE